MVTRNSSENWHQIQEDFYNIYFESFITTYFSLLRIMTVVQEDYSNNSAPNSYTNERQFTGA